MTVSVIGRHCKQNTYTIITVTSVRIKRSTCTTIRKPYFNSLLNSIVFSYGRLTNWYALNKKEQLSQQQILTQKPH